jgi:PAS domain S-box-containing protein
MDSKPVVLRFTPGTSKTKRNTYEKAFIERSLHKDIAIPENHERYQSLIEGIEEGCFEVDLAGNLTFLNESLCRIFGYPRNKLLGMNHRDYTDSETSMKMYETFHEIYLTGKPVKMTDFRITTRNGSTCTVRLSASLMRDSSGEPVGFRGIVRDVTERMAAEEALRESERKYRTLFEDSLDAIVITDRKGTFVDLNEAALTLFGYSRKEISAMVFTQLYVDRRDGGRFREEIEAKGRVADFQVKLKRKDGIALTCLVYATARHGNDGEIIGYHGIIRDISEQRATEQALRESEEKYRQLVNHAPAGIFEADFVKRAFVDVNEVMCEYTGYSKEELLSLSPLDILTEDSKRRFMERITRLLAGEDVPETVEYKIRGKNNREFWIILNTKWVYENGFPKGATGVVHDITELKFTEEALRESEQKYRLLVNHASDGICIVQGGRIKFPNPRILEILGYTAQELSELDYTNLIHPDDRAIVKMVKQKRLTNAEISSIYSVRVISKAGKQLWVQISAVPIFWENRQASLNFIRDITVQKIAEDELRKTVDKLQKVTEATVQAIAQTVEVRDPYTAGHQRRVSNIARAIGTEMELPLDMIEGVSMAGDLHDIGKISVPAQILSKAGSLTDIEFALIKTHPQTGYDILKGIEFPWDVAQIVLQHHERIDGSGYPQGLRGKDIIMEARILAVADVVEAMASHRPYRPSLGLEKALEEVSLKKGKIYDAHVVDALTRAVSTGNLNLKSILS